MLLSLKIRFMVTLSYMLCFLFRQHRYLDGLDAAGLAIVCYLHDDPDQGKIIPTLVGTDGYLTNLLHDLCFHIKAADTCLASAPSVVSDVCSPFLEDPCIGSLHLVVGADDSRSLTVQHEAHGEFFGCGGGVELYQWYALLLLCPFYKHLGQGEGV